MTDMSFMMLSRSPVLSAADIPSIMKLLSVILALSAVFACLLLTPTEAAPAPAPSPAPAPQALESLLLAKLLFLKGYLVGQYLHGNANSRSASTGRVVHH